MSDATKSRMYIKQDRRDKVRRRQRQHQHTTTTTSTHKWRRRQQQQQHNVDVNTQWWRRHTSTATTTHDVNNNTTTMTSTHNEDDDNNKKSNDNNNTTTRSFVDRPTDQTPVATNLCLFIEILDDANCCCRSNVSTLSEQGRLSARLYLMLTSSYQHNETFYIFVLRGRIVRQFPFTPLGYEWVCST